MIERLPPQSLEAEMSLLGSMMLSRDAISEVIPIVSRNEARWFYRPDHQTIFRVLVDLYDSNQPIDLVVLREELKRRNELEEVGGVDYLVACAESVPTHVNAEHYARIVRDKGLLRDLIACTGAIAEEAFDAATDASELLDRAEQKLFDVTERRITGQSVLISELVKEISARYEPGSEHVPTGLNSGFHELDVLTTGFQPGDFIVVAGRPSMGKTAFGLNVAEFLAVDEGRPVGFFSLEMSRLQVAQRLICSRAQIDSHKFRRHLINDEEREKLAWACGVFQDIPLFIDDTPGMSMLELRAKARRLARQYEIQAVFVDYLQLMQGHRRTDSRQNEVSDISRGLKALARELQVPVIAVSQLSRAPDNRQNKTPVLSDLRESGSLEQDADLVLFLYRESYYKGERDENGRDISRKAELILAKQRNGPTGQIGMYFTKEYMRFDELGG